MNDSRTTTRTTTTHTPHKRHGKTDHSMTILFSLDSNTTRKCAPSDPGSHTVTCCVSRAVSFFCTQTEPGRSWAVVSAVRLCALLMCDSGRRVHHHKCHGNQDTSTSHATAIDPTPSPSAWIVGVASQVIGAHAKCAMIPKAQGLIHELH